jgi:NAD(P)-dependent dehydrogenase (short-subunit alcohol dehydrogenase family)
VSLLNAKPTLLCALAFALILGGCSGREAEMAEKLAQAEAAANRAEDAAKRAEAAAKTLPDAALAGMPIEPEPEPPFNDELNQVAEPEPSTNEPG